MHVAPFLRRSQLSEAVDEGLISPFVGEMAGRLEGRAQSLPSAGLFAHHGQPLLHPRFAVRRHLLGREEQRLVRLNQLLESGIERL
jgi:hypothetical protein